MIDKNSEKMRIYKSVWMENNWETSEAMVDDFIEMDVSCITYVAEYGDRNIEITAENGEIEKICSVLRSYKIIDEDQAGFISENKVDIIILY
jgi:predicted sulfurtransferase